MASFSSARLPRLLLTSLALPLLAALARASDPVPVAPSPASSPTRWHERALRNQQLTRDVVWPSHEPLEFLLRRGGEHADDEPARYVRMLSSENLRLMAAAGVRYNQYFFYKGFGFDYERANFDAVARVAAEARSLGMKTSLYIGGTMFIETLYRERPEARSWERRDQWDHWISYGAQTFRHYACPNEPAYRDYIKRVLKYAVDHVHPDEIFFDNLMQQPEPWSCRCPRCQQGFREFLRARYSTPESVHRRFGLPDLDAIHVNEWQSPEQPAGTTELNDPVLQEWVRFRCESLAHYATDLADYVKQLNPKIAVTLNLKGVYTFNRYWTNAVYQPLYAGHFDSIDFDTGGFDAKIDPATGALVSQIRTYKMARRLGVNCIDFIQTDDLRAAVHMAFAEQKPTPALPGAPWHEGLNNVFTPLLEFFREYNDRYFVGTHNVADVAVLHNWPSLAYSMHAAYGPTTLVEQTLIQHQIPFDFLYEEEIGVLNRYPVVVVAGQECMSRAQADQLLAYVRQGGTLVVTDNTAEFNERRETWQTNPLLPARTEGRGQIVYIPRVIPGRLPESGKHGLIVEDPEPGATLRPGEILTPAQWVLPFNHAEIVRTIASAIPGAPSLVTGAPLTTVAELLNRPATKETLVHFVNFATARPTGDFTVSVKAQFPGAVKSVRLLSPDTNDPQELPFVVRDHRVEFKVPSVRLYSLLVLAYE